MAIPREKSESWMYKLQTQKRMISGNFRAHVGGERERAMKLSPVGGTRVGDDGARVSEWAAVSVVARRNFREWSFHSER